MGIPEYIKRDFNLLQTKLGGEFTREYQLSKDIYRSVLRAVSRVEDTGGTTLILVLGQGFIIRHHHKETCEIFRITHLFDGAYGHIFTHYNEPHECHRVRIEESVGKEFIFKEGDVHGLAVLRGYAICVIKTSKIFNPSDLYIGGH